MMGKYFVFRSMLDFVSNHTKVVDADMNWLGDRLKIQGENEKQTITIEVVIKEKEEQKNA